jgi:hypothetical protein
MLFAYLQSNMHSPDDDALLEQAAQPGMARGAASSP